jgi:glucose/arabinose dehydrogenase
MRVTARQGFGSLLFAWGALAGAAPASAALSYPGCADLAAKDFAAEVLVSNATDKTVIEPMKMAFDMDAAGNVTVYFTQRQGLLRKYDPVKKALTDLADFSKYPNFTNKFSGGSDGLLGIALDPAFKANHWVYLYVSTGNSGMGDWRVSRFTLNGDALDMASEKILIKIPQAALSVHPGGALAFDAAGNLYITTGENNKGTPSANTNDLRGKILRIHPKDDGTYSVPAGNLFPSDKYPADKARPEIYVMGARNPYTIAIDDGRHGVAWGDVGPDGKGATEEHDFTTQPGFFGYPLWAGNQIPINPSGTTDKPTNTAGDNTGLKDLPPAIPAIDPYNQSCAITGPVYYYYGASAPSSVRMPPHLNGKWLVSDFSRFTVTALGLDDAGAKITARDPLFADIQLDRILDFQTGPDGAFYFVNYAGYRDWTSKTGIVRIVYKGDCRPKTDLGPATVGIAGRIPGAAPAAARLAGDLLSIEAMGPHSLEIRDLSGRLLLARRGHGPAAYSLAALRGSGLCVATLATPNGLSNFKLVR